MEIEKEEFLKKYVEQKGLALRMIKTLKAHSNQEKVNYILSMSVELIDGKPKIKTVIDEYPKTKITARESDSDEEVYIITEFDNIDGGAN